MGTIRPSLLKKPSHLQYGPSSALTMASFRHARVSCQRTLARPFACWTGARDASAQHHHRRAQRRRSKLSGSRWVVPTTSLLDRLRLFIGSLRVCSFRPLSASRSSNPFWSIWTFRLRGATRSLIPLCELRCAWGMCKSICHSRQPTKERLFLNAEPPVSTLETL